jgi:hypothetical protein
MWEKELPEEEDELRQGDLLTDVVLPRLVAPIERYRNPNGTGHLTTVAAPEHLGLVVSQCCQNEQGEHISVSPVISTIPLNEEQLAEWLRDEPTGVEGEYVYDRFCLEELAGHITHGAAHLRGGLEGLVLKVADLSRATPISGDRSSLRAARVARMTPFGRHLLRTKLAYHWGRAEAGDVKELEQLQSPIEATPQSADTPPA